MHALATLLAFVMAASAPGVIEEPTSYPVPTVAPGESPPAGDWVPEATDGAFVALHPFWTIPGPELAILEALARCESHWGLPTYDGVSGTGRYRGPLQFSVESWRGVGGDGDPADATWEETAWRGHLLHASQGWGAWPACSRRLGLR